MSIVNNQTPTGTPIAVKASIVGSDQLRRFSLSSHSFHDLQSLIRKSFSIPEARSFVVKYKDDEDELITLSSDEELAEALHLTASSLVLRLFIDLPPLESSSSVASPVVGTSTPLTPGIPLSPWPANASFSHAQPLPMPIYRGMAVNAQPPRGPIFPFVPGQGTFYQPPARRVPTQEECSSSSSGDEKGASSEVLNQLKINQENVFAAKAEFEQKAKQLKEAKQKLWALKRSIKEERQSQKEQKRQEKQAHKKVGRCERKIEKFEKKAEKFEQKAEKRGMRDPACGPRGKPTLMMARFVKHVSIPDGTEVAPNTHFVKTWRFRNETDKHWPQGSRLLFIGKNSDRLGAPESTPVEALAPGQEVDISIPMTSPSKSGRYTAYFRLADAEGKKFGQRVWAQIFSVVDSSSSSSDSNSVEEAEFAVQLKQLSEMGFSNPKLNLRVLRKQGGNLEKAVKRLIEINNKRLALVH